MELNKFLPDKREKLSSGTVRGIQRSTGFTSIEVFRKYLWYLLRERKFDQAAVDDMVAIKVRLNLTKSGFVPFPLGLSIDYSLQLHEAIFYTAICHSFLI